MPQLLFGGLIAVILLAFYIWSIVDAICFVSHCRLTSGFTPNVQFLLNSIGGLISATVVGVLGATKPSELPAARFFQKNLNDTTQSLAAWMPSIYILVWIICGVLTVIYGFILYPADDPAPALSANAKVWLGTAIASVYAYVGISPNNGNTGGNKPADDG
ncbi:hypothetical protein BH10ACI1_BH10ACI1_11520 [soil metagenome]